jgi:hypothetical protein
VFYDTKIIWHVNTPLTGFHLGTIDAQKKFFGFEPGLPDGFLSNQKSQFV